MKTTLSFIFIFCLLQFSANAGVPEAVKKAFSAMFPDVKKAKWEKEKTGDYEAEFMRDGREITAVFDEKGQWKETETEIKPETLPEQVKLAIQKLYSHAKIKETARIQQSGKAILYEAEIKADGKHLELLFTENGDLIKS